MSKPLSWGQVDLILRRYGEFVACGGMGKLEWQEIGGALRRDLPEAHLWAMTVACKLERCPKAPVEPERPGSSWLPVVEQVLYGEGASKELQNRIEEEQRLLSRGGKVFAWISPQLAVDRIQLSRVEKNLYRLRALRDSHGNLYERGMEYLAHAFGACHAEDPSFLPFACEERA